MKKIVILGAGSWGTALAELAADNGYRVSMWARDEKVVTKINTHHINEKYFPKFLLNKGIIASTSLEQVIPQHKLIVLAIPSSSIKQICQEIKHLIDPDSSIIHVAKGFDPFSQKTMSQIITEELHCPVGTLSGPSHAEEVIAKMPTTVVAASATEELRYQMQDIWMNGNFRIYPSDDILGVELGGSLKNIIAVGSGILTGLGYGDNARAALITRGLAEMTRLAVALGAKESTIQGLSGVGDLIVTATSPHSRNFKFGKLIGEGKTIEEATKEVHMVVEGINAVKNGFELAKKTGTNMPIVTSTYQVLFEGHSPNETVEKLMSRPKKISE